jgi:hypothetical protein
MAMMVVLIVAASLFTAALAATVAFSGSWLATGVRGTVRQGFLGVFFLTPVAIVLAVFGFAIAGIVISILNVMDIVK